jgi:hypothetical protein
MDGHLCDDAIKDPAFTVPSTLQQSGGPVQSVFVHLIIEDGRGASAAADPTIRVLDGPTLVLSRSARSLTVGAPIDLFAMYGDPDEGPPGTPPSKVMVKWTATAPDGQIFPSLIDLEVPQNPADPGHVTQGERLVPPQAGTWNVGVVATDSHGKTNPQALQLAVVPDHPPCLAQWQPIAPPDGATLPITEPTRFAVPLVDDDLDPYPPVPGQPLFGTTAFEWSILPPGAPVRRRLDGATGNSIDFDPSAFVLGDIVELRVEVFDRNHVAVACADADPGCSASPGCPRRQTWRVEIR